MQSLLADSSYMGQPFAQGVGEVLGEHVTVPVAKCSELHTFKVIPTRWVVESSFAWLEKSRWLWANCGRLLNTSLQFVRLAFLGLLLKRLKQALWGIHSNPMGGYSATTQVFAASCSTRHRLSLAGEIVVLDSPITREVFSMKELICFAIGLMVGAVIMKRNQAIDELRKELEREKYRNRPASNTAPA